jgi:exodeoxyribonuclease-1
MKKTYLFYDIETSGLNKAFDQVLQFAAIRTDTDLNEIERHEVDIRLSPDVIPSPGAVLTHQITPAATAKGVPEIEAISEIHRLFNQPGTISGGYNTLGFDDEFLRFSFYRNLLPPYTHQYENGCSRFDIFPLMPLYYLYKAEAIKWPHDPMSLKLEKLAQANHVLTGAAHDAITDVIATLELAKLLQQEQKTWHYALKSASDKNVVAERNVKLPIAFTHQQQTFREGLLLNVKAGFDNAYQTPVLELGGHLHYKNQQLWLRLDTENLAQTVPETIAENTWVFKLKNGDVNFILPPTEKYSRLNQERQLLAKQNKEWLQQNPELLSEIVNYHKHYKYPNIPNIDIDAALYQNGFLSDEEQLYCKQFHAASCEEKALLLDRANEKLRKQAVRIMGRNYPNSLPKKYAEEFALDLRNAAIDYKGNQKLTPAVALSEIQGLRKTSDISEHKLHLLDELEKYIYELLDVE